MDLSQEIPPESIAVKALADTWQDVITVAGDLLVAAGSTTAEYTQEMVETVEKLGPYIVIAPGIALAHSRPSPAVKRTGLSLATLAEPVEFGSKKNDPVRLVIGLAALDHSSHLEVMSSLAKLLADQDKVAELINAENVEEITAVLAGV